MSDDDETNKAAGLYHAADTLSGEKASHHRAGRKARRKKRAPDPGWRPANRPQGGGHPAFVATRQEKVFVAAMAGVRMSHEEIAAVIGNGRGIGPIATTTLARAFKHELAGGRAHLRAVTARSIYSALRDRQPWAVALAARNVLGWDRQRSGFTVDLPGEANDLKKIEVEFISPTRRPDLEAELRASAPPSPQPSGPVDYKQPRLEPPPERELTPLGWVEKPKPSDWMR